MSFVFQLKLFATQELNLALYFCFLVHTVEIHLCVLFQPGDVPAYQAARFYCAKSGSSCPVFCVQVTHLDLSRYALAKCSFDYLAFSSVFLRLFPVKKAFFSSGPLVPVFPSVQISLSILLLFRII